MSYHIDIMRYIAWYRIKISQTYSRYWYRYIPKISHDISRILDTIPNTTSKQFRTHTWGYASLPPSSLYTAYTAVVPIFLGFLNAQHPQLAESFYSLSKQSNHMGRINLEPSQATASKHWSPHSIPIRVLVGFGSSGHNDAFFVFPTAAVDNNVYTGTSIQR